MYKMVPMHTQLRNAIGISLRISCVEFPLNFSLSPVHVVQAFGFEILEKLRDRARSRKRNASAWILRDDVILAGIPL